MTLDTIDSLLSEFNHELFLYPWEYFELRIQEEMVRADRSGIGFGYMELRFDFFQGAMGTHVDQAHFWREILKAIAETMRGSDVKGYLSNNSGIGLVFLDSKESGVIEFRNRFWQRLCAKDWIQKGVSPEQVKITCYPLEKAP